MLVFENIKLALSGLRANKMRSLLTMLGIIIGIGSVIAIMTVSSSITSAISDTFADMGANNITVGIKQKSENSEVRANGLRFGKSDRSLSVDEEDRITDEMLDSLNKEYPDKISNISVEESFGQGTVSNDGSSANISVVGMNTGYYDANEITLLAGRKIKSADLDGKKKVAVVSDKMVETVYGENYGDVLGRKINVCVDGLYYPFYIVGVYEYDESSVFSEKSSEDVETSIYIPISSGKATFHTDDGYSKFTVVSAKTIEDVTTFADQVERFMNQRYYRTNEDYEISTTTLSSMTNSMNETIQTISIAIAFIAGISLLVGGIGVMNIMLVSITERTKEIGTRKALGAKNSSIRFQFITESVMLCVIGGILGILLGLSLGGVAAKVMGYSASAPIFAIFVAVGFSMIIGVSFGYYPANKAAKLNPIEALRYE